MGYLPTEFIEQLNSLMVEITKIEDIDTRVEALNCVKQKLHGISPFKNEPVDCVIWVKVDTVEANAYNPNVVAPPEMRLLEHSISEDGYTQPIVTFETGDNREVIDGFHRSKVGKTSKKVKERVLGYLPVTTIRGDRTALNDRMAATIRHNRARGTHGVDNMSEIVVDLSRRNWSDSKIAKELGMESDEVLRLKQISGLAELFLDNEFSEAWSIEKEEY